MPANAVETVQPNASPIQSWTFRFVAMVAVALVAIPILPMLLSNLVYSFSGEAPKIYWYLSRASGFVTLTILWASMAMGIGITNKMVRLWPGAPTAFSVHQYTSLLGLAFAAYHGLVLMGDHYTDFSLPRLLTPFSIDYKNFWTGLGQISFYLWVFVVLSFYVRQFIGQKAWRVIHYVNFITYAMGFSHSFMTGTDSNATWAHGYFWISGVSILVLLAYRIYESKLKSTFSLPAFGFKRKQAQNETPVTPVPLISTVTNLPQTLLREQSQTSSPTPISAETTEQPKKEPASGTPPVVSEAIVETPAQTNAEEVPQQPVAGQKSTLTLETSTPKAVVTTQSAKVKIKPASPIETIQDNSQKSKIRVRIFREPTTEPISELRESMERADDEQRDLFIRAKKGFQTILVEPTTSQSRVQK